MTEGQIQGKMVLSSKKQGVAVFNRLLTKLKGMGKTKLVNFAHTCTISPLLVSIIVWCESTPWSIVISSCATVITTAFVDERERTAITRSCSPSAGT